MKKGLLAFGLILGLCSAQTAEAKLKIPFGEQDVIEKVADLPNTDDYLLEEGGTKYIDLGRMHSEYNIAWILPLYVTQEPKLVGVVDGQKDTYYELTDAQVDEIVAANNLKKEDLLKIGFYKKYGGKIVAGLIVLLIIWGMIPSKKKPVQAQSV